MTSKYTNLLSKITSVIFSDMQNPFYTELTTHINQDVLNEANSISKDFMTDYKKK